jgi:hypothetical protein
MSPHAKTNPGLDELIDEITVDCHDEDEQLMAFHAAFDDEARPPAKGTVIGEDIEVLSIGPSDRRRELTATCRHANRNYEIALLDIDIQADPATQRLIAAYHRWNSAF